jgi:hypothetical protein
MKKCEAGAASCSFRPSRRGLGPIPATRGLPGIAPEEIERSCRGGAKHCFLNSPPQNCSIVRQRRLEYCSYAIWARGLSARLVVYVE